MSQTKNSRPAGCIWTEWTLRTYDVWGNAEDGFEVNDSYSAGTVRLRIPCTRWNLGTPAEFVSAFPNDRQIREAFGLKCIRIETDGDDMNIEVTAAKDGYPIGEMFCISHVSLSPVDKGKMCAAGLHRIPSKADGCGDCCMVAIAEADRKGNN